MLSVKYQTQMLVLSHHMQFQLGQPDPPVPTSIFIVASPMAPCAFSPSKSTNKERCVSDKSYFWGFYQSLGEFKL